MKYKLILALAASLLASTAYAFGPEELKGQRLNATEMKALVDAAKVAAPPKNGKNYVIGFANLGRNAPFFLRVEEGIIANAKEAGAEVLVTDNAYNGATALANAESYLRRKVDYVIEFQTDANFGPVIMQKMNDAGVKVTAIDIPMAGATFMGANNSRSGFMGGNYTAQAARAKWGDKKVMTGYMIVGNLPQSGAVPAMRTDGQVAGFLAEYPDFPKAQIIKIDTKGTLEEGFKVMSDVIGRIPKGVAIMGQAINDQSILGMLRAVKQAGRDGDAIFVGIGADEGAAMIKEPSFLASVGYFPENYGNYLVPLTLMKLANAKVPSAVLITHKMVSRATVCKFYADVPCTSDKEITLEFREDAFKAHVAAQAKNPALAGFEGLLPKAD